MGRITRAVTVMVGGALLAAGAGCARGAATATGERDLAAVQATFDAWGDGTQVQGTLEHDSEHGVEVWSAEFDAPDGRREVSALGDGTLVAIEREVAPEKVPRVVREAAVRVLGSQPGEADHTRIVVYEVEDRPVPGKVRERFLDVFGNVLITRDASREAEAAESLEDLPAAARDAIASVAGGAAIDSVVAEHDGDRVVHAASWRSPAGPHELKVLDDGTVVSEELPLGRLPDAVTSLLEGGEVTGDDEAETDEAGEEAAPTGVERMLLDAWEVEAADGDMVRTAVVLPTGEILGDVAVGDGDNDEAED